MRRRNCSRTSASQRESSTGRRMVELKKRWLTERSSTVTRAPPTVPSAAPKPVMLRIIGKHLSYLPTITLSIEEVPPGAVEVHHSRHHVAGHLLVELTDEIA